MKRIIYSLVLSMAKSLAAKAKCSNPIFNDLPACPKAKPERTTNFLIADYTLIDAPIGEGSQFFTEFGSGELQVDPNDTTISSTCNGLLNFSKKVLVSKF